MLQTNGAWFGRVAQALTELQAMCRHVEKEGIPSEQKETFLPTIASQYAVALGTVKDTADHFSLPGTLVLARKLLKWLEQDDLKLTLDQLSATGNHARELRDRLIDELRVRTVVVLPEGKAQFYQVDSAAIFSESVKDKFPSADFDIREAGSSFALGRYTASVFHLMRCLEIGLNALSAKFGLSMLHDNWQTILDQIQSKVNDMGKASDKLPTWKADQEYYSQLVANFLLLKNAWRNYTAHARGKYTDEEAEIILRSVKAFMIKLSERLAE